jgi:hypothetical protein
MDNNEKNNKSYDNVNKGKTCMSDCGGNHGDINDNISDKANSVQTSYQYRKNKNGPNTLSSRHSKNNDNYNLPDDDDVSYEMSDNDNLICPNCINCTLMEEKQRREEMERNRNNEYNNNKDYSYGLIDKNRNYDRDLIEAKRRQREYNTNEASQNLARLNAELSDKEKLIQKNENSRNPLNDGGIDYQQKKFQDDYARRQKMINDNIDKYYPNLSNERPEVKSYYDKYVYNPNYGRNDDYYNDKNRIDYGEYAPKNINKGEYIKDLENQINYKNELKKREKEEERRRGQKQFEDMQKELKREEEERRLKEKKQKEELIKANMELINQKNKMKIKELEDKLKYRELYDRQNEEYQKELERERLEKERMKDDIYNHNKLEYENRQRQKEKERERDRELYDNRRYDDGRYGDNRGDNRYGDNRYDNRGDNRYDDNRGDNMYDKRYGPGFDNRGNKIYDDGYGKKGDRIYDDKYGTKDRDRDLYDNKGNRIYDDKYGGRDRDRDRERDKYGDKDREDNRYDNKGVGAHGKRKERMGRCCRCHRIFPRRLLTINRYFYKENRK